MHSAKQDPREMTDEEVMKWMQELVSNSVEERSSTGGICSLEALRNPVRRNILNTLKRRASSMNEISEKLKITRPALRLHLNFLESSCFILIEGNRVDLTPGGVSIVKKPKADLGRSISKDFRSQW